MNVDTVAVPPATLQRTPGLGIASFVIGICGFPLWIVLGVAIGHQLTDLGGRNRNLLLTLGFCIFTMLAVNALAMVMGFIAALRKEHRKTLSILGIALNAIELLLMLLV